MASSCFLAPSIAALEVVAYSFAVPLMEIASLANLADAFRGSVAIIAVMFYRRRGQKLKYSEQNRSGTDQSK